MNKRISQILEKYKNNEISLDEAEKGLSLFQPLEDFANLDTNRETRRGFPEVILGEGKEPEHLVKIFNQLCSSQDQVIITRLSPEVFEQITPELVPGGEYFPIPGLLIKDSSPLPRIGNVLVMSAGTSDVPVAEEAARITEVMGSKVTCVYDVGVAGIHRLFAHLDKINSANVIIVAAGMDGALPSVVAGLSSVPVIAVPTSVGYGASFNGIAALLSMLNSCAPGLSVVNINNGFGAGYLANMINRQTK
ncbi:MAG: nickel pincer cofactor biosynthesis protein LarB [Anaerolineales bacterium]|nr:nickel pincer cofactor biosynthesis protein LarB [Anaerolineales bacterium]